MPKKKSRSNILKCIIECLERGKCRHVLKWENRAQMIFMVKFVHRNNPTWHESDLALFVELDSLSPRKKYFDRPGYVKECKVRCKSNLKKLCKEGTLIEVDQKKDGKSKRFILYQIKDPKGTYRELMAEETVQNSLCDQNPCLEKKKASEEAPKVEKIVETEFLQPFHHPCLSQQGLSPNEDLGSGSCVDNNRVICIPLIYNSALITKAKGLEFFYSSIQEDNLSACGRGKDLSESAPFNMNTDISDSYSDQTYTSGSEISFYSDVENYDEKKEMSISNQKSMEELSENVEMEPFSTEDSYSFIVFENENIAYGSPETLEMNVDKAEETCFDEYDLDNIKPSIGLLGNDPFMGYPLPAEFSQPK